MIMNIYYEKIWVEDNFFWFCSFHNVDLKDEKTPRVQSTRPKNKERESPHSSPEKKRTDPRKPLSDYTLIPTAAEECGEATETRTWS